MVENLTGLIAEVKEDKLMAGLDCIERFHGIAQQLRQLKLLGVDRIELSESEHRLPPELKDLSYSLSIGQNGPVIATRTEDLDGQSAIRYDTLKYDGEIYYGNSGPDILDGRRLDLTRMAHYMWGGNPYNMLRQKLNETLVAKIKEKS